MKSTGIFPLPTHQPPRTPAHQPLHPGARRFFEDAPGKGGFDRSEVKGACDRVFAALGAVDPPLKQHLERLGIEPQLFLLRWFRVLFSREFHLDDAMRAWSAFFA